MTEPTGGYGVPPEVVASLHDYLTLPSPWPRPEPRRMTFRQRVVAHIRRVRYAVGGWLHDCLFGSNYCKHEGCD